MAGVATLRAKTSRYKQEGFRLEAEALSVEWQVRMNENSENDSVGLTRFHFGREQAFLTCSRSIRGSGEIAVCNACNTT